MVNVHDFLMSGPKGNLAKGWELIRKELDIEDPSRRKERLAVTIVCSTRLLAESP